MFLAVPRQLYRWPCHWLTNWLTTRHCWKTLPYSTLRDLWPMRHVMIVMMRHDLATKNTMTMTNTKTKTTTMTKTFIKQHQRAKIETCDHWDIGSEWWGDMTWPTKKTIEKTMTMTKTMTSSWRENPKRAILETCDIWSEWWGVMTWPK